MMRAGASVARIQHPRGGNWPQIDAKSGLPVYDIDGARPPEMRGPWCALETLGKGNLGMLNFTSIRALRIISATVLGAAMLFQAQVSQAGPSQAIFAFTGAGNVTSLQVTAGGVTTIVATGRGWYDADGSVNGASAANNYIVGLCGNDACNETPDHTTNNFFVFPNLAAGVPITAASLLLDVPAATPNPGYISIQPGLTYTIYDVSTPVASLGTAGAGIFTDLGTGVVYGNRTYTA